MAGGPGDATWVSPLPQTGSGAANNIVVLAAMMLRDLFAQPSPGLLQERLNDALRLYKSPMIAQYALRKGADPGRHGDAFVELARAGDAALMTVLLEGGLDASQRGTGAASIASRALYAAARAGQQGAVALLLGKISFSAEDFEGVEGAMPQLQAAIQGAKLRVTFAAGQPGGFGGLPAASQAFNAFAARRKAKPAPKTRPRLFPFAAKNSA